MGGGRYVLCGVWRVRPDPPVPDPGGLRAAMRKPVMRAALRAGPAPSAGVTRPPPPAARVGERAEGTKKWGWPFGLEMSRMPIRQGRVSRAFRWRLSRRPGSGPILGRPLHAVRASGSAIRLRDRRRTTAPQASRSQSWLVYDSSRRRIGTEAGSGSPITPDDVGKKLTFNWVAGHV